MKKFLTLLCMITCVFGLTACGKEKEVLQYDSAMAEIAVESVYNLISQEYDAEFVNQIKAYDKFQWEEIEAGWRQAGLKAEGNAVIGGIESFSKAKSEIGAIVGTTGTRYQADKETMIAYISVDGQSHDAEIEIIFDKDLIVTSITTNVDYTFGEQMGKAALNTLMGMGTVFTVLILIMAIISCFKYISIAEAKAADKKKTKEAGTVDNTIAQIIQKEEVEAEVSDDCELVAVIAAAIAASEGKTSTDGFVVRSIRKRY